ncbi:MAG: aminoacyl-tRNA hydrolase [Alphaproteobacteria bacterium]|nr:aminoacyl-tRNA hydrolase [Alphaproteobacteria bacterium]
MRLLVGLGNPGPKHRDNRHNIGFMAADEIVRRYNLSAPRTRFQSDTFDGTIDGEKVLLLKPTTFMNESGRAVGEAARFFKVPPEDIIVIYDEIDLAAGKMRVKRGGGLAGHNGLRSIKDHLGTPDFVRVRLGIGHPGDKEKVHGHVLGDFSKQDQKWVEAELRAVADALPALLDGRDSDFMSQVTMAVQQATGTGRKSSKKPTDDGDDKSTPAKQDTAPAEPAEPAEESQTSLGAALNRAFSKIRGN